MLKINWTSQQLDFHSCEAKKIIVIAFAGAAKSTSLIGYAQRYPLKRFLYLAFTRSVADEATQKFPKNVVCLSTHQLAWKTYRKIYQSKLGDNLRLTAVSKALDNNDDWTFVRIVTDTVTNYAKVAEDTKDIEMNRALRIVNGYDDLMVKLEQLRKMTVSKEADADIVVTTAHRCKGLEWPYIQLMEDFPDPLDPEMSREESDAEINLLYVVLTRGMLITAVNSIVVALMREARRREIAAENEAARLATPQSYA